MLHSAIALQLCVLVLMICRCCAEGSFFAVMPKEFHPGQLYNISVTSHKNSRNPVKVVAEFVHTTTVLSATESFMPGETRIISLMIPQNLQDQASVVMRTEGETQYSREVSVQFNGHRSMVLSETDKAIYKPGQTVRLRIINIDKFLRPVTSPLTVYIENPMDYKVEEFKNISSSTGVTEREFQLSEYPTEGNWSILVMDNDVPVHRAYFQVEEFVLPKFSVEMKPTPSYVVATNDAWSTLTIAVNTRYTYGKAVQGKCTLTIGSGSMQETIVKDLSKSGVTVFSDFPGLKNLLRVQMPFQLTATAEVTDVTGRTESGETAVMVYATNKKLEILDTSTRVLRRGLPAHVHIRLSDLDGNPVDDRKLEAMIRISDTGLSTIRRDLEVPVGQTDVTFTFDLPNWDKIEEYSHHPWVVQVIVQLVSFRKLQSSWNFQIYYGTGENVIMVQPKANQTITVGQPAEFLVTHNQGSDLRTVAYSVVHEGDIVESGQPVGDVISVLPTVDMCPQAELLVYMMVGSSEALLATDSVNIVPMSCFEKEVRVTFDAAETRVNSDVNMQVMVDRTDGSNALPGVHDVYYLAIDKSIVLLQGESGLTERSIMKIKPTAGEIEPPSGRSDSKVYGSDYMTDTGVIWVVLQEKSEESWIRPPDDYEYLEMAGMVVDDADIRFKGRADVAMSMPDSGENEKKPVSDVTSASKPHVRKNFPDTWLWGHGQTAANGRMTKKVTLPDTITSWRVSAFAINSEGLALCRNPFELTAFQVFFVSLNLPYSVKRGEVFALRVTVFNYRPQEIDALVRLQQNDGFDLVDSQMTDGWNERNIKIPGNQASSVEFKISIKTLGLLELRVTAEDMADGMKDEVKRELLVKPEGEERSRAITQTLLLPQSLQEMNHTFTLPCPPADKIVPGSQRVEVKITGDIFGQALSNLKNLVRMPFGCGEQNMITTVPNIFGLTYIRETKQTVEESVEDQMLRFMKLGYQREVDNYRHQDGSYSAWGERDGSPGSTWLTAFVVKSFAQASKYISIDSAILTSGVDFLKKRQSTNGAIREQGKVLHSEMQSGTGKGSGLTVYVLISLLETTKALGSDLLTLDTQINRAVGYMMENLSIESLRQDRNKFLAALAAYALSLVPEPESNVRQFTEDLLQLVLDLGAPWEETAEKRAPDMVEAPGYSHRRVFSQDIEIASYYLLTLTQLQRLDLGLSVMKWIQSQQNSLGGFSSTQDTVMALQALSIYGALTKENNPQGTVTVSDPASGQTFGVDISGSRGLLLQTVELPGETDTVKVSLQSPGKIMAVVKVVYIYYTQAGDDDQAAPEPEVLVYTKSSRLAQNLHKVEACVQSSNSLKYSGMFVTTINLPSGERAAEDLATIRANNPHAVNVETDEQAIHFYMQEPPGKGYCLQAQLEREMDFDIQKPGSARIYAYYEPEVANEVALALEECDSSQCGGRATSIMLNFANILLTVVICMLISLLMCV